MYATTNYQFVMRAVSVWMGLAEPYGVCTIKKDYSREEEKWDSLPIQAQSAVLYAQNRLVVY